MGEQRLCLGCMNPKGEEEVCGNCGWREGTSPESSHYLPPGTVVKERYLLGRVLGQGGFGITYLGWDQVLNTRVAVKEFMPPGIVVRTPGQATVTPLKSGELENLFVYGKERFLDEARTLARFEDHPGVVSVKDVFQANGTAYMVMQYLEGMTLNEYRLQKGGAIPYQVAREVMMPVLDTLREVHRAGILHRDISPDNIFITRTGTVKLLDFGAARFAMGEHSRNYSVILKAGYAPEEQYRSRGRQGEYTDVYSVAATLYQLITGQLPLEALDRLAEDTLLPPSQLGVGIPPAAEVAMMKALSVRAEQRYQSIAEFQEALLGDGETEKPAVVAEPPVSVIKGEEKIPVEAAVVEPLAPETKVAGLPQTEILDVVLDEESPTVSDYLLETPPVEALPRTGLSRQVRNGLLAAVGVVLLAAGAWYAVGLYKASPPVPAVTAENQGASSSQPPAATPQPAAVEASPGAEVKNEPAENQPPPEEIQKNIVVSKEKKAETPSVPAAPKNEGSTTPSDGYRKLDLGKGVVYEGEIKNGKIEGQGTVTSPNGGKMTGEFRDGLLNGYGKVILPNGEKYEGGFIDGVMSGQGIYTWPDGSVYDGGWQNNKFNGWGVYKGSNGFKYVGEYKDDKKHGQGTATFADGGKYEGEWKYGLPNGWGTMTFSDGMYYTGFFKDGLPVKS